MGGREKDGDTGEESGQEELGVDVSKLDPHQFGTFQKDRGQGIPGCMVCMTMLFRDLFIPIQSIRLKSVFDLLLAYHFVVIISPHLA